MPSNWFLYFRQIFSTPAIDKEPDIISAQFYKKAMPAAMLPAWLLVFTVSVVFSPDTERSDHCHVVDVNQLGCVAPVARCNDVSKGIGCIQRGEAGDTRLHGVTMQLHEQVDGGI